MTDPKQWSLEAAWEAVKKRDSQLSDKKIIQILVDQLVEVRNRAVNKAYIDKATTYLSMWQAAKQCILDEAAQNPSPVIHRNYGHWRISSRSNGVVNINMYRSKDDL
ncbi:hypothetical protein O0I10_004963 [Lichtheimia ornata]|uniref:Uncharacterized protein n=1 Tax=Lichtheimia ornata TaxID=688661 RepID=A0AAD7V5E3_9FUNG|nr:uncharacterized protein O0I10_004963 [Lichtheimia ornata]KAJ8659249.1 hypothetical protein O0I10_004963 [Lichtheimia ornata]